MRAGPLSNDSIIRLINSYYVPFYSSFSDYSNGEGGVSKEDAVLFDNIMKEFRKTAFSTGTVHVYVFTGELVPLGTLHVAKAAREEILKPFLNDLVVKQKIASGDPPYSPRPQSVPPRAEPGSLILHVFIRGITIVPEFPHEDWVVLTQREASQLLPANATQPGASWLLDTKGVSRFVERIHPTLEWLVQSQTFNYETRIDKLALRATTLSTDADVSTAKIDGSMKMLRTAFGFAREDSYVNANLMGYMRFNAKRILSLELIIKDAFYGAKEFEGYVESAPGEPPREFSPRLPGGAAGSAH